MPLRTPAAGCITFTQPVATRWNATSKVGADRAATGPTGPWNASGLLPWIERVVVAEHRVPGHVEPDRLERLVGRLEQPGEVAHRHVAARASPGVVLAVRRVAVAVLAVAVELSGS